MDPVKLREIIRDKNDQRERSVVRTAEEIIEQIVNMQRAVVKSQKRIEELRAELQALQIEQLDEKTILGEV